MPLDFYLSSLELVCHVLPGAVLPSSERGAESNQTSGQIPVCQNGGVRLFLVTINMTVSSCTGIFLKQMQTLCWHACVYYLTMK